MRSLIVICLVGVLGFLAAPMVGGAQAMDGAALTDGAMPAVHCASCDADGHSTEPSTCSHVSLCCVSVPARMAGYAAFEPAPVRYPVPAPQRSASLSPGIELQPPRV